MSTYSNIYVALNGTELVNLFNENVPDFRPMSSVRSEENDSVHHVPMFPGRTLSPVYISQLMQFSLPFWHLQTSVLKKKIKIKKIDFFCLL